MIRFPPLCREAERRGCGLADARFALGDGGAWIWFAVEELFPGAIPILDACHAAKAVLDSGEMAEALARRWCRLAESGELQPAVDELGSHAPRRGKAGETASNF